MFTPSDFSQLTFCDLMAQPIKQHYDDLWLIVLSKTIMGWWKVTWEKLLVGKFYQKTLLHLGDVPNKTIFQYYLPLYAVPIWSSGCFSNTPVNCQSWPVRFNLELFAYFSCMYYFFPALANLVTNCTWYKFIAWMYRSIKYSTFIKSSIKIMTY